jgi:hypothetical protein
VPNLMTDRVIWVTGLGPGGNVRRLMYQTLIWVLVLADDACRLGAPLDAEDRQRLADALIDGVRRNFEFGGDFLGGKVLVDQQEAVELSRAQPRDALGHVILSGNSPSVRSIF